MADANTDDAFPSLHHLDEILPAIAGDPVFRLYDRGEFLIVNAEQYGEETFPEPSPACSPRIRRYRLLRRECRGLVFDAQGHLLARRYHKFFAVGEREQTRLEVLLASESAPPLVLEKLDGALLCPVRLPGGLRLLSRRGISPLSLAAEDFAAASSGHRALWAALLEAGQTPLLEWCHRDHRLVVDHPAPRLVLTGVRERTSGRYLAHEAVVALGASFGVEVVRDRGHATDLRALVHQIEAEEEGEGVVLRWPSGRLCKLKTLRYRRLHRATEAHQRTRAQWEVLFHGEGALLCALLPPEEAAAFRDLEARVHAEVRQRAAALADRAHTHRHSGGTVQDLGLAARSLRGPERAALFAAWAGQDPEVALWSALRRGAESSRGLAELRQWFMPEKTGG